MKFLSITILIVVLISKVSGRSDVKFSADIETLKFAQVIFRHGDRTPLPDSIYPNDPYKSQSHWPEGFGQLTEKGKARMFKFGEYLRYRYAGFLNRVYSSSEVYALSSEIERCIGSGELTVDGLFHSLKMRSGSSWQNPPIHTIPYGLDNKLDFSAECKKYKEAQDVYLNSEEMRRKHGNDMMLFRVLNSFSGGNITNIFGVMDLYDTLFVESENEFPLPNWTKNYFPEVLKPMAAECFEAIVGNEELQGFRGGPLLKELFLNSKLKIENEEGKWRGLKLILFSGHDSTISALLMALGVFNKQIPPYGSAIFFELHKYKTEKFHFLRIFFRNNSNQAPFELEIPHCPFPCRLERLRQLKRRILLNDWIGSCETSRMDQLTEFGSYLTKSASSFLSIPLKFLNIL